MGASSSTPAPSAKASQVEAQSSNSSSWYDYLLGDPSGCPSSSFYGTLKSCPNAIEDISREIVELDDKEERTPHKVGAEDGTAVVVSTPQVVKLMTPEKAAKPHSKLWERTQVFDKPAQQSPGFKREGQMSRWDALTTMYMKGHWGRPTTLTVAQQMQRPLWQLANVSEEQVLKAGIRRIHKELVKIKNANAKKPDGAPTMLRSSFLMRLLNDQLELKGVLESDVCTAQSDLRHLTAEQLLAIHIKTNTRFTESESHSAHASFMQTVNRHLFEKIARKCLCATVSLPVDPRPLRILGIRITLLLGAAEMMKNISQGNLAANSAPSRWALKLDDRDWPEECMAAQFDIDTLSLQPLLGDPPTFHGDAVAIVRDRSTGNGRNRTLHWAVVVIDPNSDDVIAEMINSDFSTVEKQRRLTEELQSVLMNRSSVDQKEAGRPKGGSWPN